MDLIYTDENWKDVGILKNYTFDLAFGKDENNFELTLDIKDHCCTANCLIYVEGTEYGGIVDRIRVSTKNNTVTYIGRTWHGILASKIITPDVVNGDAYYTVSDEDANFIIHQLINDINAMGLFFAPNVMAWVHVDHFQFPRYVDAYSGLKKMLASVNAKLKFTYDREIRQIELAAVPIVDYTQDETFDHDQVELEIEKAYNPVNHVICLGKGELLDRMTTAYYRDRNGSTYGGNVHIIFDKTADLDGYSVIYDNPNAESAVELHYAAYDILDGASADKMSINFVPKDDKYDVGDIIGGKEYVTGITASAVITKKIVNIKGGEVTVQYEVGE